MTTSVTSSLVGWAGIVLIPAVFGCPTAPQPNVIALQEYQWHPPLLIASAEKPSVSEAELARLYAEAAEEDRDLANQGLSDWGRGLAEEDRAE